MEVTINIDGQALSAEVTVEVYEYLDRAGHATTKHFTPWTFLTGRRSTHWNTARQRKKLS
jgi:RNA polymerase sigma-70 factor (ECF subfamily)